MKQQIYDLRRKYKNWRLYRRLVQAVRDIQVPEPSEGLREKLMQDAMAAADARAAAYRPTRSWSWAYACAVVLLLGAGAWAILPQVHLNRRGYEPIGYSRPNQLNTLRDSHKEVAQDTHRKTAAPSQAEAPKTTSPRSTKPASPHIPSVGKITPGTMGTAPDRKSPGPTPNTSSGWAGYAGHASSSTGGFTSAVWTGQRSAARVIGSSRPAFTRTALGSASSVAGPDYTPPTYTLGASISLPVSFDVDEFGRMYVIDEGRTQVLVFGSDGSLEARWRDGDLGPDSIVVHAYIQVLASDLIFLGGRLGMFGNPDKDSLLRLSTQDPNGFSRSPHGGGIGRPDGGFYEGGAFKGMGRVRSYDRDSKLLGEAKYQVGDHDSLLAGVDSAGNLYKFDKKTSVLRVWNADASQIREMRVSPPDDEEGSPDTYQEMAVDANGDLYAATCGKRIYSFDSEGNRKLAWDAWIDPREERNTGWGACYWGLKARNGIIYRMFFSDRDVPDGIQAYTPDGRCIVRYLFCKTEFNTPNAIAVQPDGSFAVGQLWSRTPEVGTVPSPDGRRVTKTIVPDAEMLMAGPDGTYYSKMRTSGLCRVSTAGEILERILGTAPRDQREPGPKAFWTAIGEEQVTSISPHPPSGGLCLFTWNDIRVVARDGRLLSKVPFGLAYGAPAVSPAVDSHGAIYAAFVRPMRHEVAKYDASGKLLKAFSSEGRDLGQLSWPEGVLVDSKDNLYVLDTGNSRVQVFNPSGEPIGAWGRQGGGDGELDHPKAMCWGPNNTLWIADTLNDRIVWITLENFWRELRRDAAPAPAPAMLVRREALPGSGRVALSGVITSDARDGAVYAQHPTGSWGVRLRLPRGASVARGKAYRIAGSLAAEGGENLVTAKSLTPIKQAASPRPIRLASACLTGSGKSQAVQSGVLVATWGRVTSIDKPRREFTVSDGSTPTGVRVSCGSRVKGAPPVKPGQYVALTGVVIATGQSQALRIRETSDIRNLGMGKPGPKVVAWAMGKWP